MSELADYAAQYRHFETWLPGYLARLLAQLPAGEAHDLVAANLDDELGDPVPHVELFEGFAQGVGAPTAAPSEAMAGLLATYDDLLESGPVQGLAGFVAYEVQAADVARNKADGLRRHYGLGDGAVAFWEHHADVDERHADWAVSALGLMTHEPSETGVPVHRAANAWWRFLDEREAVGRAA
jgi:pyrroloquinoline quinone (PQQ) biosynthesis protein C